MAIAKLFVILSEAACFVFPTAQRWARGAVEESLFFCGSEHNVATNREEQWKSDSTI
jgi:hypothetical protein